MHCELISWATVQRLAGLLARRIRAAGFRPQVVIAIARGGFVPARLLCDHLDLADLSAIRITHYTPGATRQPRAVLTEGLCRDLAGRAALLVDDTSDSGQTLALARQHLLERGAGEVRIAVLHHKLGSTVTPDFYGQQVLRWRWIVYPWALHEDVGEFMRRLPPGTREPATIAAQLRQTLGIRVRPQLIAELLSTPSAADKYRATESLAKP